MRMRLATAFAATLLIAASLPPAVAQPRNKPFDLGITVNVPAKAVSGGNIQIDIDVTNYWNVSHPKGAIVTIVVVGKVPGDFQMTSASWISKNMTASCTVGPDTTTNPPSSAVHCQEELQNNWKVNQTRKLRVFATVSALPPPPGSTKFVELCGIIHQDNPWSDPNISGPSRNAHCVQIEVSAPMNANEYDLGISKSGPRGTAQNSSVDYTITISNQHSLSLKQNKKITVIDTWTKASEFEYVSAAWNSPNIKDGKCEKVQSSPRFICVGTLRADFEPKDTIMINAKLKALLPTPRAENCAELATIQGMVDVNDKGDSRFKSCHLLTVAAPPPAKHDLSIGVTLPGGPIWQLGSLQKVVLNVDALQSPLLSPLPVGSKIQARAILDGLQPGNGKAQSWIEVKSTGAQGWKCMWGAWEKDESNIVECELTVSGTSFSTSSLEIDVVPALNAWDTNNKNGWLEASVSATVSSPSDMHQQSHATKLPSTVDVMGFDLRAKKYIVKQVNTTETIVSKNDWTFGSTQKFRIQVEKFTYYLDNGTLFNTSIDFNDAWFTSAQTLTIQDELPAGVQYIGWSGQGWKCTTPPAKIVTCTYTAKTLSKVASSVPYVDISVRVTGANNFTNEAKIIKGPIITFPTMDSAEFKDANGENNLSNSVAVTVPSPYDVRVSMSSVPTQPTQGESLEFTVLIQNESKNPQQNTPMDIPGAVAGTIVIQDDYSQGFPSMAFVSGSSSPNWNCGTSWTPPDQDLGPLFPKAKKWKHKGFQCTRNSTILVAGTVEKLVFKTKAPIIDAITTLWVDGTTGSWDGKNGVIQMNCANAVLTGDLTSNNRVCASVLVTAK